MPKKLKAAAVLTIHDPANFSPAGKRRVLAWLERQAKFIRRNSKQMSKRFTARYLYA